MIPPINTIVAYWITTDTWAPALLGKFEYPEEEPGRAVIAYFDAANQMINCPSTIFYNGAFASGTAGVYTDYPSRGEVAPITDNTGGSTDGDVDAVAFPLVSATTINNNIAELTAKVNQIIDYLKL